MKKLRFFLALSLLLSSLAIMAQKYNPEIYDERGQYLREPFAPFEENRFELGLYSIGPRTYPVIDIETSSKLNSSMGIWGFVRCAQAVISQDWRDKGYKINEKYYSPNINVALSYEKGFVKSFAGIGFNLGQSFFGPLIGTDIKIGDLQIKAFGMYSLICAYKASYSEEEYALYGHLGDPIIIDGFDPNSWWRITCGYKLSDRFNLGFISERFYATGLFGEYELRFPSMEIKKMYLKFISGRNFMFKENSFFMGTVLYL